MKEIICMAAMSMALCLLTTSCKAEEKKHNANVPYYYGGFAHYYKPFRPVEELTADEAKKREAYFVAYYDEQGRIVSFTKYLYGKIEFTERYFYRASGIIEREEYSKANGETGTHYYDEKGKPIKTK